MRVWLVPKGCDRLDDLRLEERADPRPGPGQVLVRVRAASLNYRDQAVVGGTYFGGPVARDTIPLSDGAGEIAAVGEGVARFRPGDRVASLFFQPAAEGTLPPPTLGTPLDGMLAELVALDEDGVVALPPDLSFEQAACLPCAGVTAWHALMRVGRPTRHGDTVLALGTGGVSMFVLQIARAAGARVIVTSSSDRKLERARSLGATDTINYVATPDWDREVLRLTDGRGVDCVVEIGGAGTLARSMQSLAQGGKIGLVGFLAGPGDAAPHGLMRKAGSLHGIFVGGRDMAQELNRAVAVNRIVPVVDRVFPFEQAIDAWRYQLAGAFVGKVVIAV